MNKAGWLACLAVACLLVTAQAARKQPRGKIPKSGPLHNIHVVPFTWRLTKIAAVVGSKQRCPLGVPKTLNGFTSHQMIRDSHDFNKGTGVPKVFLCKDRVPPSSTTPRVVDARVYSTKSKGFKCPPGFVAVSGGGRAMLNLNAGTGGNFVFMCYKTATSRPKSGTMIANLMVVQAPKGSKKRVPCLPPYKDLPGPVNINTAGGSITNICQRTTAFQ